MWEDKKNALKASQNKKCDEDLKAAAKEATRQFKIVSKEAKCDKYEEFCKEVTADKALHKFWQLYGAMNNKQKSRTIPDFQREDNVWVRSDEEKGEALFNRYMLQTNQDNEQERKDLISEHK